MRSLLVVLVLLPWWAVACAQETITDSTFHIRGYERHDELTLLAGYHQGRYGFVELGLGRNIWGVVHHPFDVGYYLGAELRADRPELHGVKVGAYVDGGMAMGMQLIQYMEGGEGCTVLRPEIGIGIFKAKMTYAYNVGLSAHRIEGISTHMLSLTYAIRLKRLQGDDAKKTQP
ncbi:MAG: hypothetical protein ABI432_07025 [Flavobacteriales bacterium]